MPDGPVQFLPNNQLLSYQQIAQIAAVCTELGIEKYRITGEPLARPNLHEPFGVPRQDPRYQRRRANN